MVKKIIVLGGGTAGFIAALTLKRKLHALGVLVVRSKDIGTIGVGEGSTPALTRHLHRELGIGFKKFFDVARPTWKLGLKFLTWGTRPHFFYTFAPEYTYAAVPGLRKLNGYYRDAVGGAGDGGGGDAGGPSGCNIHAALMERDLLCLRQADGSPRLDLPYSYHFENEKFVRHLEGVAAASGIPILDDTVAEVRRDESGVTALVLKSGRTETADLYVDCSGFVSLLLGKTLGERFQSFKSSLFCDRAVAGGWERGPDEPIKPYTTCEAMDGGWCWQIEHETRVNRGYVYASDFVSDEDAEREFRSKNPKVTSTRVIRFTSGRYDRSWVKNVVAIGNASGFVEPLEATAIAVICSQSLFLARVLNDADLALPAASQVRLYNDRNARDWDSIRRFIAVHYKFNARQQTPFWQACREHTDLAGAEPVVEFYQENGPSVLWDRLLLDPIDSFGMEGYFALLLGQNVPYRRSGQPSDAERKAWSAYRQRLSDAAARGVPVNEALRAVHSPGWNWNAPGIYSGPG